MRKVYFFIILTICLSACAQAPEPTPPSVVTQVDIRYSYGDMQLYRHFTDTGKIDIVLYYLYDLSPWGTPPEDPEQLWGDSCRITLTESDGSHHIYRQQGGRYLSVDNKPWQNISQNKSAVLLPLLINMESDR